MFNCKRIVIATALSMFACGPALSADNYPTRPVRMIVPFAPGGASDFVGRIIQPALVEQLGQQVVIENRSGAGGNIGVESAARASADGYTFLLGNVGTMAINPVYFTKFPIKPLKDLTPVSQVVDVPGSLVVNPSLPVKNVKALVALAKARPAELTYGTSGAGSMSHLAGEMFKRLAKVDITTVPYQGGVFSIAAVQGGHIMMMFSDAQPVMANIKAGKLRALAVTSETRTPFTPELPTLAEEGITGFAAANWWGILFPTGVPKPVIDKVSTDLGRALATQDVKDKLAVYGVEAVYSTPQQYADFLKSESDRWGRLIKEAGISAIQ
jgi:tripartite-type tricarboxylate transporter receptor subunit TctC